MLMRIKRFRNNGFTLVEIMIVVAIIALLASIAIPNLVEARRKAQRVACKANLKAIDGAKAEWALTMRKGDADVPADTDLFGLGKPIETKPLCPASGSYDLKAVSDKPTCTVPDHAL